MKAPQTSINSVVGLLQGNWVMSDDSLQSISIRGDMITLYNSDIDTFTYQYQLSKLLIFDGDTITSQGSEYIFHIKEETSWGIFYLTGIDSSTFSLMAYNNLLPVIYNKKLP